MDDNRRTGLRFVAFILVTLALIEIGWATQTDGGGMVGALTGLAVSLLVTGVIMAISSIPDD